MKKAIALIAHDNRKDEMVAWCQVNRDALSRYSLWATGTTGDVIARNTGLEVSRVLSGPLGRPANRQQNRGGEIDILIFFWDPPTAQPHDPDIKALLRGGGPQERPRRHPQPGYG